MSWPDAVAVGPRVERAHERERVASRPLPGWVRALLSVPLLAKIAGANALIVVIAAISALSMHRIDHSDQVLVGMLVLSLVVSLAVSLVLVHVALRPIRELETTAERVWRGDLEARARPSIVADRDMVRVGRTINLLLDSLTSDRARMRRLASQVISAQDEERARIARELHDSTAQTLTAVVLQLSAAVRDTADPAMVQRLAEVKTMAGAALEEVRNMSHRMHPRVLDDLGLVAALEWLARNANESTGVGVTVEALGEVADLTPTAGPVLYRVAQEALGNAIRHAAPTAVAIALRATRDTATLEIVDDGRGFDVAEAEARRPGMGLFSMRERVSLVDGHLEVSSAPGAGTRVLATIPLTSLRQA
jgi:signal transduction histidine kinase